MDFYQCGMQFVKFRKVHKKLDERGKAFGYANLSISHGLLQWVNSSNLSNGRSTEDEAEHDSTL